MQQPHRVRDPHLVVAAHRDEHRALARHARAAAELALGERDLERAVDAHDLAGRTHLRTKHGVDAGEAREREDGFLHADVVELLFLQLEIGELFARHDARGNLRDRRADHLRHERHRTRGARIDFQHVDIAVLDGKLHVHQADDVEAEGKLTRLPLQLLDGVGIERMRR